MTDREIIEGLIALDARITQEFFFGQCRPLLCSIIGLVFNGGVDYDELVNELYLYLMENDAARLRGFQYRCSVHQWIKVLAIRYFIKRQDRVIDDVSHEPPYHHEDSDEDSHASEDLERLFELMPNKRYVMVIRRLVLADEDTEQLAREMNITAANLYNIKQRAMAQLARVALNDIQQYGKQ